MNAWWVRWSGHVVGCTRVDAETADKAAAEFDRTLHHHDGRLILDIEFDEYKSVSEANAEITIDEVEEIEGEMDE